MAFMSNSTWIYFIGDDNTNELAYKSKTGVRQVYSQIIKEHNASNPYEDPEFPRTKDSIGQIGFDTAQGSSVSYPKWDGTFHWKRVADLVPAGSKVQFFGVTEEEKISRFDLAQGSTGDCWFLAAVAELTLHPDIINFIILPNNAENNDSGAYHFRIRLYGCCIDVVVDDWLPCAEFWGPGRGFSPIGMKPVTVDGVSRIWAPMLEKAYAKLNGNYAITEGNFPRYAFEDLTGGLGLYQRLNDPEFSEQAARDEFWKKLIGLHSAGNAFFSWWTGVDKIPKEGYMGLHAQHAYTMTGITELEVDGKTVKLVRLRNPWGRGEWIGPWSDGALEWENVSAEKKAELKLQDREDGEFWVEYDVLMDKFYQVDYCIGVPQGVVAKVGERSRAFDKSEYHGRWSIKDGTAGGRYSIANNPQFFVNVGNSSDPDCPPGMLAVSLAVKQALKGAESKFYGYRIYKVAPGNKYQMVANTSEKGGYHYEQDFFDDPENTLVATSASIDKKSDKDFVSSFGREVAESYTVPAGEYVFVTTQWEENAEADFHFRVWYDAYTYGGIVQSIETYSSPVLPDPY